MSAKNPGQSHTNASFPKASNPLQNSAENPSLASASATDWSRLMVWVAATGSSGSTAAAIPALLPLSNAKTRNSSGETPLMEAARLGNLAAVEILLPVSDITAVDDWGEDALMHAALGSDSPDRAAVLALLGGVADLSHRNNDGWSALEVAAHGGRLMAVAALIPLQGIDGQGAPKPTLVNAAEIATETNASLGMTFAPWLGLPAMESALRKWVCRAARENGAETLLERLIPLARGLERTPEERQGDGRNHWGASSLLGHAFQIARNRKQWPQMDALSACLSLEQARRALRGVSKDPQEQALRMPRCAARLEKVEIEGAVAVGEKKKNELSPKVSPEEKPQNGAGRNEPKSAARRRL